MSRICQVAGQSAATVTRPNGGVIARSGIICNTPSNPQNDGGKLGHTINTFRFDPSGGKEVGSSDVSGSVVAGSTVRGCFDGGVPGRTLSRGSDSEGIVPLSKCVIPGPRVGVIPCVTRIEDRWHSWT